LQRLLIIQAGLVLFAAIGSFYYFGGHAVSATLFGGAIAMANTILLSRRLEAASDLAADNPNAGALTLYLGVIQRFVLTLVMFAVGIKVLKLVPPEAMVGGFAIAYLGFMICGSTQKK
jgi:ATP synthase protein I